MNELFSSHTRLIRFDVLISGLIIMSVILKIRVFHGSLGILELVKAINVTDSASSRLSKVTRTVQ